MAYVGTPSRLGSARDTLASIIQGEAGGEGLRGMQAVGGVIANRAASNFSGYGTSPVAQATARMQFQGQSNNPSANAYSVADSVLAGTNPDPTGGALYYANPGDSSARWARNLDSSNSLQIGNHFFTDNAKGIPFSGSNAVSNPLNTNDPLSYTGPSGFQTAGVDGTVGSNITGFKSPTGNLNDATEVTLGFDGDIGTGTGAGGGGITASSFGDNANVANGLGTGGQGSFGLSGIQANGQGVNTGLGAGNGSAAFGGTTGQPFGGSQGSGSATGAGSGDPIVGYNSAGPVIGASTVVGAINTSGAKVSGSVDKGAKQIGDDTKEAGKTIGQSVTGLSSQLKGISDSWQALGKDYFIRLAFIIVGLIALAAALLMFKPVQNAAVAVASKVPKVPV